MDERLLRGLQSKNPEDRRAAIDAVVRNGDPRGLDALKRIYETDPDPAVRAYAQQAGLELWKRLKGQRPAAAPLQASQAQPPAAPKEESIRRTTEEPQSSAIAGDAADPDISMAQRRFSRALALHMQGETQKALKEFAAGLELHPELASDTFTANLAAELTGLPPAEAIRSFTESSPEKELPVPQQPAEKKPRKKPSPVTLALLVIAVAALIGVSYYFVNAGYPARYLHLYRKTAFSRYRESASGWEYYLVPPRGQEPQGGWPLVVGLHGYGGDGRDMYAAAPTLRNEGVLYVSPTFGEFDPFPDGPIHPMLQILDDVGERYALQERGAVLLGFSQGGMFAYRFSVYHPERVAGVVTAGAPAFDDLNPTQSSMPYFFTWGEYDGLKDFVMPKSVYPLIRQGYNVRYEIVEGAGHQLTQYAIDRALEMALAGP